MMASPSQACKGDSECPPTQFCHPTGPETGVCSPRNRELRSFQPTGSEGNIGIPMKYCINIGIEISAK